MRAAQISTFLSSSQRYLQGELKNLRKVEISPSKPLPNDQVQSQGIEDISQGAPRPVHPKL